MPNSFHFSDPLWLWLLLFVPFIWILFYLVLPRPSLRTKDYREFADAHLLPHLLNEYASGQQENSIWKTLLFWSIIWSFGFVSMAGPRWNYTDVKAFQPAHMLVILLDLSRSMNVEDTKPSRLIRAHQEIEDILKLSHGLHVGLVAFANVSHMITPPTDDYVTIQDLLPSIKTDIVFTQGSRLLPALEMASRMLESEPGKEKHILILSDGGFDDGDASILRMEQTLIEKGVKVHTMGFGTSQGGPVPDGKGGFMRQSGKVVLTSLEEERLIRISHDGNGLYLESDFQDKDTIALLSQIQTDANERMEREQVTRIWDEKYYLFLVPCILFSLPWFIRGTKFISIFIFLIFGLSQPTYANDGLKEIFLNSQQKGQRALEEKRFHDAEEIFKDDPYKLGVVQYKSGDFVAAEKSFEQAEKVSPVEDATYNLGNARLINGHIEDAIKAYESVLKNNPDHLDAKHNLEIAKKLLEKKNNNNSNNSQQDSQKQDSQKQDSQKQDSQKQDSQKQDSQKQDSQKQDSQKQDSQKQDSQKQDSQKQDSQKQDSQKQDSQKQDSQKQDSQKQDSQKQDSQKQDSQKQDSQKQDSQKQDSQKQDSQKQDSQKQDSQKQDSQKQDSQKQDSQKQDSQKQDSQKQDSQKDTFPPQPESKSSLKGFNQDELLQDEKFSNTEDESKRKQEDIDADQWLSHIKSDTDTFLKNKFMIESKRQSAQEGEQSW